MRAAMVLSAVCCLCWSSAAIAQQFPYAAQVAGATSYYGTTSSKKPAGELPAGSAVEVHQQHGQWLAIRPPQGSYSWVRAIAVTPTNQPSVVTVRGANTTCWIGYAGFDKRIDSQIELSAGERLHVLENSLVGDEAEIVQWYKIAPPSGEFRFIRTDSVTRADQAIGSGVPVTPASWSTRTAPTAAPAPAPASPAPVQQAASNLPPLPTALMPASSKEVVTQHLDQIDQQLSAMLAHPPASWNPTAVVPQLQAVAATGPTAELRARAQTLLDQAARSEQVKQGYQQVASSFQASVQPAAAASTFAVQPAHTQLATAGYAVQPAAYHVVSSTPRPATAVNVSPEFRAAAPGQLMTRVRQAAHSVSEAIAPRGRIAGYGRQLSEDGLAMISSGSQADAAHDVIASPVDENGYSGKGWLMPLTARTQMPLE